MATTYTTNYNLGKQENHADKFDMDVITDNADKIDAALTGLQSGIDGKQAALTTEQLAAVNSGITSTDVEQIETNKNNISSLVKNGGGLNFLQLKTSYSIDGGTITINSDGTLRVLTSGSLSNNLIFEINTVTLPAGNYILSGCPANGSENTYRMDIVSGVVAIDVGTGASFTLTQSMSIAPRIRLVAGSSYDLIFKPMISQNSIPFQPYAMSNAEITAWILAHS